MAILSWPYTVYVDSYGTSKSLKFMSCCLLGCLSNLHAHGKEHGAFLDGMLFLKGSIIPNTNPKHWWWTPWKRTLQLRSTQSNQCSPRTYIYIVFVKNKPPKQYQLNKPPKYIRISTNLTHCLYLACLFSRYICPQKKLCTPCFSYKYTSMVDVENLLNENQRVNPFGLFQVVRKLAKWEKHRFQNGPSDTVASESSPEPARGQLKPLLPFALRGEARMVLPPKFNGRNLKSWWFPLKENIPFQGLLKSGEPCEKFQGCMLGWFFRMKSSRWDVTIIIQAIDLLVRLPSATKCSMFLGYKFIHTKSVPPLGVSIYIDQNNNETTIVKYVHSCQVTIVLCHFKAFYYDAASGWRGRSGGKGLGGQDPSWGEWMDWWAI